MLQDFTGVTQERLNIGPNDLFHVPAVDAIGRTLLAAESVEPTGELSAVAMVVMVEADALTR
jgi:hypothetical protein